MNMDRQIRRGEVYYADLSPVIGSEQGGIRPVIILQNDMGNEYSSTTIVAAITSSTDKSRLPTHVDIDCDGLYKKSIVLLEQFRTIDKSRLREKIGKVGKETMGKIDYAIIKSLGIGKMNSILQ